MNTRWRGVWPLLVECRLAVAVASCMVSAATALRAETFTHRLTESTATLELWTTTPAQEVFADDPVPSVTVSGVRVFAARGELEPFVLVARPTNPTSLAVNVSGFGAGVAAELFRVEMVTVSVASDHLGQVGPHPDPLWPLPNGVTVDFAAGANTSLWIRLRVAADATPGERVGSVQIGGVVVPVTLHVFDFALPAELHVPVQIGLDYNVLATAYGSTDFQRWDWAKQNAIDLRLTPRSLFYPTALASGSGAPVVSYDCETSGLSDPDGIFGFEENAARYLDGTGLLQGTFGAPFNDGVGFSTFFAINGGFNDPSVDPRPANFCGLARSAADWYAANDPTTPYNQAWFGYMAALEGYLDGFGYLDRAAHFMANEPQDQADYDAIAWYSRHLSAAAPGLRLLVSEEPKVGIFGSSHYVASGQVDIWTPVLQRFDPAVSAARLADHGEETWLYFLPSTRPPFFNPMTLDHPGIEARLTGWFLWKNRVRGLFFDRFNLWSPNPWTTPAAEGQNGAFFLIYPPSKSNTPIVLGSNGERWVPSIRLELIRDSLEDYEYLRLYAGGADPMPGVATDADAQATKMIGGAASFTDDPEFLYELRRQLGLFLGGEIQALPELLPPPRHPRAAAVPAAYHVNFQNPLGLPASTRVEDTWGTGFSERYVLLDGDEYLQVGTATYDPAAGYGWRDDTTQFVAGRNTSTGETDERRITYVYDDLANHPSVFDFDLPNGYYHVELSVGTPQAVRLHNRVIVEGVGFIDDEASTPFLVRRRLVYVQDSRLTLELGLPLEYTMIDYLIIEPADPPLFVDGFELGDTSAWTLKTP